MEFSNGLYTAAFVAPLLLVLVWCLCSQVSGEKRGNAVTRLCSWSHSCLSRVSALVDERSPAVQVFYLSLVSGSLFFYYTAVVPLVSTHMNSIYNLIAYLTFAFEYLSFYWVSVSDPGRITKENHSNAMSMFPYDFVMFYPRTCRTCLFTKVARSKHCSACNACIARQDHHCVWVNNCIGHANYRLFLLFLLSNLWTGFYIGLLTLGSLSRLKTAKGWDGAVWVMHRKTQERYTLSDWGKWRHLLLLEPLAGALSIFGLLVGLLVMGFLVYQFSMILPGKTTNEVFKWDDITEAISKSTEKVKITKSIWDRNQARETFDAKDLAVLNDCKEEHTLENISELVFVYNRGWRQNLAQVLWPVPLNARSISPPKKQKQKQGHKKKK